MYLRTYKNRHKRKKWKCKKTDLNYLQIKIKISYINELLYKIGTKQKRSINLKPQQQKLFQPKHKEKES